MEIRPFQRADEAALIALWEECELTRPWNDPRKDIARKLAVQPELFLVGTVNGEIVGSVMAGYEGHRGWVNYLAVAPCSSRRGHARALMQRVEQQLLARGSPKLTLQLRNTNPAAIAFYRRLGYAQDDSVSLGKRLISDEVG